MDWSKIRKFAGDRWEAGRAEHGDTWKERNMYKEALEEIGDLFNYIRKQGEKTKSKEEIHDLMMTQIKVVELFELVTKMDEKYNGGA